MPGTTRKFAIFAAVAVTAVVTAGTTAAVAGRIAGQHASAAQPAVTFSGSGIDQVVAVGSPANDVSNSTTTPRQPDWCVVQLMANKAEMQPGDGSDMAFDSTDNGSETSGSWESHATERFIKRPAGTYTIRALGYVQQFGSTTPTFWTGEREMTVETSLTPA
jgi:predicted membrane-bound mannosyltransferase